MTVERYTSRDFGMCDLCGKVSPPGLELHTGLCDEVRALREAVAELRARIDSELGRETVPVEGEKP